MDVDSCGLRQSDQTVCCALNGKRWQAVRGASFGFPDGERQAVRTRLEGKL